MPQRLAWGFSKRLALLTIGIFFSLLAAPTLIGLVPFVGDAVVGEIYKGWEAIIPHIGRLVFGIPTITVLPNGSGDTTWNHLHLLAVTTLAVIAGVTTALANPRRLDHEMLYRWFVVLLRYALAVTMLGYGLDKIFGPQFQPVELVDLVTRYGDMSPMRVLWRFMGLSRGYILFAAGAQILSAFLLMFRRTATLGALLASVVLCNIVLLNIHYDVPVKLLSLRLLLMSIFVMSRDAKRLLDFFVLQRTPGPPDLGPVFEQRWMRVFGVATKAYVVVSFAFMSLQSPPQSASPLQGLYRVEEFKLDGQMVPALASDPSLCTTMSPVNPQH